MCKTCTKLAHFLGITCTFGGGRSHRTTRQTVIECVDSIPFLALPTIGFYAILAHWEHPKVCHCGYSPAANGRIKRTMSAVDFRDKTRVCTQKSEFAHKSASLAQAKTGTNFA